MKELIIQIFGIIGKPSALAEIFGDGKSFSLDDLEEKLLGIKKKQTIRVKINSGGGSVIERFAILDRLKELESQGHKVITEVLGLAGSMASVIATAPKDVKDRLMHANSEYFVHNPFFRPQGDEALEADDLAALAKSLTDSQDRILDHYAKATGTKKDKLQGFMDEKKALTSQEAKDLGFIGEIVGEEVKEAAEIMGNQHVFCYYDPKEKEDDPKDDSKVGKLESLYKKLMKKVDALASRKPDVKSATGFGEWLTSKSEDEAVKGKIIEAVGQDVYDGLVSGDQACPSQEQVDKIAGATGDDSKTVMDVAIADGCEFDAEAALVASLRKQLNSQRKEIKDLKEKIVPEESQEMKDLKAEFAVMEEMIVGLKEDGSDFDSKKSKKGKTVLDHFADNFNNSKYALKKS